jgi:O-methyltransferase
MLDIEGARMEDAKQLYLDLMKRTLTYLVYGQEEFSPAQRPRDFVKRIVFDALVKRDIVPMRRLQVDDENRIEGRDWPAVGLTMVGMKRLNQLQECAEEVLVHNVPGDFIEAGTWRGGAAIFLRAILKAHCVIDRDVWVADSFEGLPSPDGSKYPADTGDYDFTSPILAVPLEQVKLNFARFGLLDDRVQFVKGWFRDSLPGLRDKKWSVIRLDGDMYESTMDGLKFLYPNLSVGGYVIIDDYGGLECCRKAVHDFREEYKISEEIQKVDWTGVYWRRLNND